MKLASLQDLFLEQLKDVYDAETQLVEALPAMAKAAHSPQLRTGFQNHLEQTRQHAKRLEQIFQQMDTPPKAKKCKAMQGLIKEGQEMIDQNAEPEVRDAGLIAAAQRVEHYEIAAYGTLRTYAQQLGKHQAVTLLEQTLQEEKETDHKLTQIAESSVNVQAAHAS